MARRDEIGKVSVGVSPDFDQAELFRQVRAATAKIPAINIPVKITAKSVNQAVREVNQKKLAALNLPVKISAASVRTAVKEYNARPGKKPAILVDVKFNKAQIKRALKDAYDGGTIVAAVRETGKKVEKEEEKTTNNRRTIAVSYKRWRVNLEKLTSDELKTLWQNNAKFEADLLKQNEQLRKMLWKESEARAKREQADTERSIKGQMDARAAMWKHAERLASEHQAKIIKRIKEEESVRKNMWQNAVRIDKERMRAAAKAAKTASAIDKAFGRGRGIGQFAANIVILRSAFSLVRLSAIGTFFGFIAQAAAGATAAVTSLTSAVSVGLTGALLTAGTGAAAFAQGMGVWKFAMQGVKEAIGGTNGLNESLNKALKTEAFEGLTDSTKEFVREMEKLKPLARGLQAELQEGLFEGVLEALRIAKPLLNDFVGPLRQTSEVLGDISVYAAETGKVMSGDLNRALANNNLILRAMGESGVDLAAALVDILVTAQPMVLVFAKGMRVLSATARSFIANAQASGELADFMKLAGGNLRVMLRLSENLGRILLSTFRAALPFGTLLLMQLERVSGRIAEMASGERGQKSLKAFFEGAMPAIHEFGLLMAALGREFVKLASQPGLALVLRTIREELVPALGKMIAKVTEEFGPVLVVTLTQIAGLFAVLASESGPLNNLVFTVGALAGWLAQVAADHPRLLRFVSAIFLLEAALSIAAVQGFLFRMSGLGAVIGAVTQRLIGAQGFIPVLQRLGQLLRTGAGMARFLGLVGLVITGIMVLVDMFDQLFIRLKNGEGFGSSFAKAFSHAVLGVLIDTAKAIDWLLDKLGGLSTVVKALPNGQILGAALEGLGDSAAEKGLDSLIGKLEEYQSIVTAVPIPMEDKKTDFADVNKMMAEFQKQMNAANKEFAKNFEESMKGAGAFEEIGIAVSDTKKETDAATEANKAHSRAMAGIRAQTTGARQALDSFGAVVERQRTLVDALASALDELRNIQLEGTQAFSDAKFALDQESKALELQQVQLKLGGATDEDPRIKELQKQLDVLALRAQEVDLNESLQLDPLRRQWDQTINPIKELSFDKAMAAFKGLTFQHQVQTVKLQKLEAQYKAMEARIQSTERSAQKLSATFRSQVGTLPATALDGGAQAGTALLKGLETGARSQLTDGSSLHKLLNKEIPDYIKENKGPIAYDQTILVPAGQAIMDGLETGLRRGFEPVKGYLREVGPSMEEYVPDSLFAKRTAQFLVEVAAGKKPDPKKFFGDLEQGGSFTASGGIFDPRLGFLHKPLSFADTAQMAASLAKTFGLSNPRGGQLLRPAGTMTASGNISDHTRGIAADLAGPADAMRALAIALKPLVGTLVKQLIYTPVIRTGNPTVDGMHYDHVHVAFNPAAGFSLMSGRIAKPAFKQSPYLDIFQDASRKFDVPIALLQAVTKAESGFNPRAGSYAGAKGLMQLMPATFLAQHVGSNIFDPRQNIFAGAKYLSAQLRRFKSVKLALAAYNAGPGNAALGLRAFAETIAYVARVMNFLKDFGGFRELGGPTMGGKAYVVGERGPELWMERRPGHIINNKDLTEMVSLLREIRDTGGLRQQTTNIQTASQDPAVIAEMLERKRRRKLSRVR